MKGKIAVYDYTSESHGRKNHFYGKYLYYRHHRLVLKDGKFKLNQITVVP
jgi:hypothetical protein